MHDIMVTAIQYKYTTVLKLGYIVQILYLVRFPLP